MTDKDLQACGGGRRGEETVTTAPPLARDVL
jgi:hypothetical protein